MLVQCPSCHTTYRVSDSLVTAPNPAFRCSRCKHIFALGSKTEANAPVETPRAPPTPPRQTQEQELSLSFPAGKKQETAEQKPTDAPEKNTALALTAPPKSAQSESLSFPQEAPPPGTAKEDLPPNLEMENASISEAPLPPKGAKEESWSLTAAPPEQEKSFTIPDENRSFSVESPSESSDELQDNWQDALPMLEEREAGQGADRDRPLSVVPYISLFGALLLAYALIALMYQAQPKTIETAIKTIPWLGQALLKNNHLRHGMVLQSIRPGFQTIQGNREVFVLSGLAVNRNAVSVREVRVEGFIFNAEGKEIDRQTISVGNAISSKILRDLTTQEISILQRLNPQKRFEISPDQSAGFVIVFLKPSAEVKNFSCRVLSVEEGV